jgi:hypothetical protein
MHRLVLACAVAAVAVLGLAAPASAAPARPASCSNYVRAYYDPADAGVNVHVIADSCGIWHRAVILVAPLCYPFPGCGKHWVRSRWLRGTGWVSAAGGFGSPDAYGWGFDFLYGGRSYYVQTGS